MTTFTPMNVLGNMMNICDKYNETHKKNLFKNLYYNLGYAAPEIREERFWYGTNNWYGILEILNNNFNTIDDCNIEMDKYYKNVLKLYKEKHGFDKIK